MKKLIIVAVVLTAIISCGPSASEKAAVAKADSVKVADSIAAIKPVCIDSVKVDSTKAIKK